MAQKSLEAYLKQYRPDMLEEYKRFQRKDELPAVGTSVETLCAGFGGSGGDVRYVKGYYLKSKTKVMSTYDSVDDVKYIQLGHSMSSGEDGKYCLNPERWWLDVKILREAEGDMKYFVCDRVRAWINQSYADSFLNEYPRTRLHFTEADAWDELHHGFYDDSDYTVCGIDKQGRVHILREERRPK